MAVSFPQWANSEDLLLAVHTTFMFYIVNHLTWTAAWTAEIKSQEKLNNTGVGGGKATFADTFKGQIKM